jgi:iron complex outermembrane recepter protein
MNDDVRDAGRSTTVHAAVRALVYLGMASGAMLATHAAAQEVKQEAGAEEVSEVVVTGSRIRGVAPVGAPVIALGRDNLAISAATTVADFLKEVPQVVGIGVDETRFATSGINASNVSRATAINLRGLSPAATLTLLDGHRVTPSGTSGAFVDSSAIPAVAVQRLEIVADGASALYGSDAVAGVVNMILRKDFVGAETSLRNSSADGYSRLQASQLFGHDWGSGNAMVAYEYMTNDALSSSERSFFRQDQRAQGGNDFRAQSCNPGTVRIGTNTYAIPQLPPNTAPTAASLVRGTFNLCDNSLADIIPKQSRHSAVVYLNQEINDRASVSFEAFWSKKDLLVTYAGQGSASTTTVLNVPATNAYFARPAGTTGNVQVDYNFLSQYGALSADGESETYSGVLEGVLKLGGDWRANLGVVWGQNYDYTFSRAVDPAALSRALASGNQATALNPWGLGTPQAVVNEILSGQFSPDGRNTMSGSTLRADGPLFEISGGMVRMAVGAEWHDYSLKPGVTRGTITAPVRTFDPPGPRTVKSGYVELYVPLVGVNNARPGLQRLDLSIAGRLDEYSDFGRTTNPKIGLTWTPLNSLTVKGSYGTSFRAPSLSDLKAPGEATQVSTQPDPRSVTGTSRGLNIRAGNADLGPETSRTWTVGLDWHPESLPDLRTDLTYFNISYDNQIASIQGNALQQEALYVDVITRNPTQAQVAATIARWPLNGVLPIPVEFITDGRPQNRGKTTAGGFDLQASYGWTLPDASRLRVSVSGTYYTRFDTQQTPTAPTLGRISVINFPVEYRARTSLSWTRGGFNSNLWFNFQDSYLDNSVTPNRTVSAFNTVDLALGYAFSEDFGKWLEGVSVNVNTTNLLDEDPPFVNVTAGYDPQQASPFGRFIAAGITKTW